MLQVLGPQQRRLVLAVLVLSVVAIAAIWFFMRDEEVPPPRSSGPAPVVLVHGYGGNSSAMASIAARLEREGLEVTSLDLPDGGRGDLEASAGVVAAAVDAIGAEHVDLIGFSAGGVVVRAYLEHFDGIDKARYVITLGSPHHGTTLGGAIILADPGLCVDACAQMAPGSEFLEELNEPDETPAGPVFVTVWTILDETVTPPDTAELDGAINVQVQSVCPASRAGHGDLPRDPMVLGLILETLRGDLRAAPDEASCQRLTALGR